MRTAFGKAVLVMCCTSVVFVGGALGSEGRELGTHPSMTPQEVRISVTDAGFVPSSIVVKKGVPITVLITRKTDQTCAMQAVFPSIKKRVDLPLGKAVRVALPAQSAGHLSYSCGMEMLHGELVFK